MRRLALQQNAQAAGGAIDHAGLEPHLAQRHTGQVVQSEGKVWRDCSISRVFHHAPGAIAGLFGRLEQQDGAPLARALATQFPTQAGQNRHMAVVTAHMGCAWDLRGMRHAGQFLDRQGIELGAEQHSRARNAAVIDKSYAMPAQVGEHQVRPRIGEEGDNSSSRPLFLAGNFRLLVQAVPEVCQLDEVQIGQGHPARPQPS